MKVHSKIGLVTNSSGEVFIARKDQVPENVDDVIRTLWRVWYNEHADGYEKEGFSIDTDPAPWFAMESMESENDIHYGRDYTQAQAVQEFMRRYHESKERPYMPGDLDPMTVARVLEQHPDVLMFCEWYSELNTQWFNEDREPGNYWIREANRHVSEMAVEAGLFDEFEEIAMLFGQAGGMFDQWRLVTRDFRMYRAYQEAELQGEVDDHIHPAGFVHFVANTLGWFCYHNG